MAKEQLERLRGTDDASGRSTAHLRQHNLSAILTLLHEEGAVQRSVLTARTGLNRSTIAGLVAELVELGFVVESHAAPPTGVGRPSLMVQPSPRVVAFSAVVEVDGVSVAAVDLAGNVVRQIRHPLPDAPAARTAVAVILESIELIRNELGRDLIACGLGVAVPGQVEDRTGVVTESTPLHWANVNLAESLQERLNLPVFVDNDARIGLRSWHQIGHSGAAHNVVYVHGRESGISGAIVVDGELLRGNAGLAGAVGLIRVQYEKAVSWHEHPGTLDALVRRDTLVESFGVDEMTEEELDRALRTKLPSRARRMVDAQIGWFASGLATIVNLFNPELVVLDGFLAPLFEVNRDQILNQAQAESVARAFENVEFVCKAPAPASELRGAAELPMRELIASPLQIERFKRPALVAL